MMCFFAVESVAALLCGTALTVHSPHALQMSFTFYPASSQCPGSCQGAWRMELLTGKSDGKTCQGLLSRQRFHCSCPGPVLYSGNVHTLPVSSVRHKGSTWLWDPAGHGRILATGMPKPRADLIPPGQLVGSPAAATAAAVDRGRLLGAVMDPGTASLGSGLAGAGGANAFVVRCAQVCFLPACLSGAVQVSPCTGSMPLHRRTGAAFSCPVISCLEDRGTLGAWAFGCNSVFSGPWSPCSHTGATTCCGMACSGSGRWSFLPPAPLALYS